jgi:uncharacterized protein (TIGR03437 family)
MTLALPLAFIVVLGCFGQTINLAPDNISQRFPSGATNPITVAVTSTGGGLTARVSTDMGGNWLFALSRAGGVDVTIDPTGLPDGTFQGSVTVVQGAFSKVLPVAALIGNTGPQLVSGGVVSAASYIGGAVSPGELVTVFGTGIGPDVPFEAKVENGKVANKLAATRVWFDNVAAPLIYAYPNQLAAIVPFEVAGKDSVQVQVENAVSRTVRFSLDVKEAKPALFTTDASGKGSLAALNQDGTVNSLANPASKGSIVVLYATGTGSVMPAIQTGSVVAGPPLPAPKLAAQVRVDGKISEVLYYGSAPGLVAGITQLNIRVPESAASGNVGVIISVSGFQSPEGTTIAVK